MPLTYFSCLCCSYCSGLIKAIIYVPTDCSGLISLWYRSAVLNFSFRADIQEEVLGNEYEVVSLGQCAMYLVLKKIKSCVPLHFTANSAITIPFYVCPHPWHESTDVVLCYIPCKKWLDVCVYVCL